MARNHTMSVFVDVLGESVALDVSYQFTPGRPEVRYLRNGDPGYPAEPAEIEVTGITIGGAAVPDWFFKIASESDDVHGCILMHHDDGPDPDDARDAMREAAAEKWEGD